MEKYHVDCNECWIKCEIDENATIVRNVERFLIKWEKTEKKSEGLVPCHRQLGEEIKNSLLIERQVMKVRNDHHEVEKSIQ